MLHALWPQQAPPLAQGGAAFALWLPPFVIAPAPPLISLFTLPPHSGQASIGASDIFCRFSKRQWQASHKYS
jgi:hypothetical protein